MTVPLFFNNPFRPCFRNSHRPRPAAVRAEEATHQTRQLRRCTYKVWDSTLWHKPARLPSPVSVQPLSATVAHTRTSVRAPVCGSRRRTPQTGVAPAPARRSGRRHRGRRRRREHRMAHLRRRGSVKGRSGARAFQTGAMGVLPGRKMAYRIWTGHEFVPIARCDPT